MRGRRDRARVARRHVPAETWEVAAYGAGARAARSGDHGPLLAARTGTVPAWVLTEQELAAIAGHDVESICRWYLRGWTEETSRLAEADRQAGEEE